MFTVELYFLSAAAAAMNSVASETYLILIQWNLNMASAKTNKGCRNQLINLNKLFNQLS